MSSYWTQLHYYIEWMSHFPFQSVSKNKRFVLPCTLLNTLCFSVCNWNSVYQKKLVVKSINNTPFWLNMASRCSIYISTLWVTLRTPHAKNQPPRLKTVAYRPRTDRHTHTHTDRQRKQTLRTPFFEKFFFWFSIFC